MHVLRYGGRVMCGRSIDDVTYLVEDGELAAFDGARCKTCMRAVEADNERGLAEDRELDGVSLVNDDTPPDDCGWQREVK